MTPRSKILFLKMNCESLNHISEQKIKVNANVMNRIVKELLYNIIVTKSRRNN